MEQEQQQEEQQQQWQQQQEQENLSSSFLHYHLVILCIPKARFLLELYYDLTTDIDLDETNTRAFLSRALVPEVRKSYKDTSSSDRT